MSTVIKLTTSEDESIVFVAEPSANSALSPDVQTKGGRADQTAQVEASFSAYFDPLRRLANQLAKKIGEIDVSPDEVEVSLGVKLTAETGIVFAKAGADAEMNVTMTWKKGG